jgi:prepilin signal peptidase PulO-like enzyme (type II secretory pathway)
MAYFIFIIALVIASLSLTLAICKAQRLPSEEQKGLLAYWWKWLNTKDPNVQTRRITPDSAIRGKLESSLCPICGAGLSIQQVQELNYGYDIECTYCGTTISLPRMNY